MKDGNGKVLTDGKIASTVNELFDLRPYSIVKRFGLKDPVFLRTASYGHFGRNPETGEVEVFYEVPGSEPRTVNNKGKKAWKKKVEYFGWEKLDVVEQIRKACGI